MAANARQTLVLMKLCGKLYSCDGKSTRLKRLGCPYNVILIDILDTRSLRWTIPMARIGTASDESWTPAMARQRVILDST